MTNEMKKEIIEYKMKREMSIINFYEKKLADAIERHKALKEEYKTVK
jgi:hypothetical protein